MGIETEFGVTCTFHGHRRLSPDEVARYLFRRVVSWGRSSNVFLRNGARLYLDVGSHPEYATAECPMDRSLRGRPQLLRLNGQLRRKGTPTGLLLPDERRGAFRRAGAFGRKPE